MSASSDQPVRSSAGWRISACGVAAVVLFAAHSALDRSLPGADDPARLLDYAGRHHAGMLASAWLDGSAVILLALFIVGVVRGTTAAGDLAGTVALLGAALMATLVLMNDVFIIAAARAAGRSDATGTTTARELIAAVNLVFPFGNLLWMTGLATVVSRSRAAPRAVGYLGVGLGLAELVIGPTALASTPALDNAWFSLAAVWVVATAISIGLRGTRLEQATGGR